MSVHTIYEGPGDMSDTQEAIRLLATAIAWLTQSVVSVSGTRDAGAILDKLGEALTLLEEAT